MPERLDLNASLEAQARQVHALRNKARAAARELMADRNLAAERTKSNLNLSWDQVVEKTVGKGFEGGNVLREIISSYQRSRAGVSQKLGIE